MTKRTTNLLVGTAIAATVMTVMYTVSPYQRTVSTKSPVKMRWDTPERTPDRYRIYIDGKRIAEIQPPGGPVGCRCQETAVQVPLGSHKIALRSLVLGPPEMESPATEITVNIEP